jgi:hypothetical protein
MTKCIPVQGDLLSLASLTKVTWGSIFGPADTLGQWPFDGPGNLGPLGLRVCDPHCSLHREFSGRKTLERTVRPVLIVIPSPGINLLTGILERFEPAHVQAFFAKSSVKGFEDRAVGRFTESTEVHQHVIAVGPKIHLTT